MIFMNSKVFILSALYDCHVPSYVSIYELSQKIETLTIYPLAMPI